MIPRPAGTAGSKWSIQVEMGLGGTGKKYDLYKAIQVGASRHKSIVHSPMMPTHTHTLYSEVFATWYIMPVSIGNYRGVKFLLATRQHSMKL